MRVWVTGIAGFLGSHIAQEMLDQGHIVSGNDSLICGDGENSPVDFFRVDCCNNDYMSDLLRNFRPDVVIHCAATAHEGLSNFSPSFITKNIYEASVSVFSAAISSGVKRIVFMSSMSRYGDLQPPFNESMAPKPVDPYAIAKVAAEETLKVLCNTHNVKWSIAVPHNIIGVRQRYVDPYRNVCSIMINRCKQGKAPIVYGDGLQTRSFSPVKDCIPSIVAMCHGYADGEVVNIGPDKNVISIKEVAEKIVNITGCNKEIIYVPDRPNEVKHASCSSDKARKLLGYKEVQSIDDCLKEMADCIKPKPFVYDFPLEIINDKTPVTWKEKMI